MLIDGKLVEGRAGRSPTSTRPPKRSSARSPTPRTPTCTAPSTPPGVRSTRPTGRPNRAFRQQCLRQLQEALEVEQESLREELILEVGCPRMVTHGPQLDRRWRRPRPTRSSSSTRIPGRTELGDAMVELTGQVNTRKVWREPVGVVGAIVPWNYPFEVTLHKLGPGARHRQHRRAEARPGHSLQRHPHRTAGRRAH